MKKFLFSLAALALLIAPMAPAVNAAAADGVGPWADSFDKLTLTTQKGGGAIAVDRTNGSAALGAAETAGNPYDTVVAGSFLSLGFGGSVEIGFVNAIENGAGNDLRVYEVTGGSSYPDEKARVEASHNGVDWVTLSPDATRDEDLDLGMLPCASFVRITDISDPAPFEATADGFDLDAVRALNSSEAPCDAVSSVQVVKSASAAEVLPGEEVTYTYVVTNTGDFDLDTVVVSDDKCAPVTGPTGDIGDLGVLEPNEAWTYSCTMNLDETTTNVVTVSADDPWDNEVGDTDEETVAVKELGCTLTQGYWKNHSSYGKAPYDNTWAEVGEDTSFFSSGQSYHQVLWTAPKGGNAYYQLAHQYIAAQLNAENDAFLPADVFAAWNQAKDMFEVYTPAQVSGMKGAAKQAWTNLAGILAGYNEGATVTPHCSEI